MILGYEEGKPCPGCGQWTHPNYTHTCPPDEKTPKKEFEGWYVQDDNELLIEILDTLKDIKSLLEALNEGEIFTKRETIEITGCHPDSNDVGGTVGNPDGEPVENEL